MQLAIFDNVLKISFLFLRQYAKDFGVLRLI